MYHLRLPLILMEGMMLILALCINSYSKPAVQSINDYNAINTMENVLSELGFLNGMQKSSRQFLPVVFEGASQDWANMTADKSCITQQPIKIGDKLFAKGLGSHANSRAVFSLKNGFDRFVSDVGIENNGQTGVNSTVVFIVKLDGREAARTPVCRGGESACQLDLPLNGATTVELIIEDAGDGIIGDHADWGDARLVRKDGSVFYLSDSMVKASSYEELLSRQIPASFVYDGISSRSILSNWSSTEAPLIEAGNRIIHEKTWKEPASGFSATWHVEVLRNEPAMEFKWIFKNEGNELAKILSDVNALDFSTDVAPFRGKLIHSSGGLTGTLNDSVIIDPYGFQLNQSFLGKWSFTPSGSGKPYDLILSAARGRSSNKDFPFFIMHDMDRNKGFYGGVGWSGQWEAAFSFSNPYKELHVSVYMPDTHIALPPGETIVSPTVLIGTYQGGSEMGTRDLRRVLLDYYIPKFRKQELTPPVLWNSWFCFETNINEANIKKQADICSELGIEYVCIDAGWSADMGDWKVDRSKFPEGINTVSTYVKNKGMKLGLWFEPERASSDSELMKNHPEWVHDMLVDFGNPEALDWIFKAVSDNIGQGIEWLKWDFNIDPLSIWEKMDTPDTKGLSQIRHVMGLYSLLDRLLEAYPDVLFEGCASGGRRIDLETLRRFHTQWRSDLSSDLPTMRAMQTGANVFLPGSQQNQLLMTIDNMSDVQSIFGGLLGFGMDLSKLSKDKKSIIRKQVDIYKEIRQYLNRDFYSVFPMTSQGDSTAWVGWQFHEPDKNEGFVVIIRPNASPYETAVVKLTGLIENSKYNVSDMDTGSMRRVLSEKLAGGWSIKLNKPKSSIVFRYRLHM